MGDGKKEAAAAVIHGRASQSMRRIRIALLALLVLILSGWTLFELGWLRAARSGPPGGADSVQVRGDDSSGTFLGVAPSLAVEPGSAREAVAEDRERRLSGILLVRVTDRASGSLVEGASIALERLTPASHAEDLADRSEVLRNPAGQTDAVTDERGEARIEVPGGIRMRLLVHDRGPEVGRTEESIAPLAAGELREVLVELPRGLDLEHWVRAVVDPGGVPVPGASVRLIFAGEPLSSSSDGRTAGAPPAAVADSEGLARLRVPSWRTALARIDAPGFGSRIAAVVPGHDAPLRAQVVALAHSASLTAEVATSPGIPLSGASVVLTLPASEIAIPRGTSVLGGDLVWSAATDEQGRCRIEDLPPEVPIRVEIRRGPEVLRRLADPWTFSAGERAERSVCLSGAARLIGLLLLGPQSKPVTQTEIWLARAPAPTEPGSRSREAASRYFWTGNLEEPFARTRTDEAGSFTFEGLEVGDWWVGPAPARGSADGEADSIAPRAELVHVLAGASEIEVVLRAGPGRWIRGKVVDPADVPVAQTVVEAHALDALGSPSTRTSPDGTFALGPLAEGQLRIRARGRWGWTDSAEATVRAGDRDVLLRLSPGAILRGRAIDRETGAPCVATLHLDRQGSGGREPRALSASAGRDGTFEFRGLVPGTYDLQARSEDGRVSLLRDVVVRLGESSAPTVVSLAPGARLRIRNEGKSAAGTFAVLFDGQLLEDGRVGAGTSAFVVVPAGRVTVRFTTGAERSEEREIEARAGGEETEVVFSPD